MLSSTSEESVTNTLNRSVEVSSPVGSSFHTADYHDLEAESGKRNPLYSIAALQMTTILQTTLKPESVLRRFSRAVAESVSHSGMIFTAESGTYKISLGRKAKHRCTFTLILEHRTLGDLVLTRGKPFLEAEAEQLEYLVSALAYPLRNSLEHRKALQASMTDPLTGIYNRSIVEHTLRREVRLARRFRNNFSLILFDIDGFKAVNDIHGHEKGDEAIIVVVNCVSESLRETDIFARYGGDEFVILLNNTGKKGAKTLATHILARAHQSDCLNFPEIPITLSIGVATLKADENEKSFLKRVDKAMYRAKGRGGDQIHVAGGKAIIRSTI